MAVFAHAMPGADYVAAFGAKAISKVLPTSGYVKRVLSVQVVCSAPVCVSNKQLCMPHKRVRTHTSCTQRAGKVDGCADIF